MSAFDPKRTSWELNLLDLGRPDSIADADLELGDQIVTAGLGGPFPKGVQLGTVTRIVRDPLTGVARASVTPAARLGRLEEVLCLPATAAK